MSCPDPRRRRGPCPSPGAGGQAPRRSRALRRKPDLHGTGPQGRSGNRQARCGPGRIRAGEPSAGASSPRRRRCRGRGAGATGPSGQRRGAAHGPVRAEPGARTEAGGRLKVYRWDRRCRWRGASRPNLAVATAVARSPDPRCAHPGQNRSEALPSSVAARTARPRMRCRLLRSGQVPRGFARSVGSATVGSSGQGWRG